MEADPEADPEAEEAEEEVPRRPRPRAAQRLGRLRLSAICWFFVRMESWCVTFLVSPFFVVLVAACSDAVPTG